MVCAGPALILTLCAYVEDHRQVVAVHPPSPNPVAVNDPRGAITAARQTPLRVYLLAPLTLEACETEAQLNPESKRWVVTFKAAGRPFLEVDVSAETGAILDSRFRDAAGPVPTAAEALSALHGDPALAEYLRQNRHTDLVPGFWAEGRVWWVRLYQDGRLVGGALVYPHAVVSTGPWRVKRGDWPRHLWNHLRPNFSRHQVLYLCAGLFLVVVLAARPVTAWYALDVAALLLLLPGLLLVRPMPGWGYPILWGVTLYLFARAVRLSLGGRDLLGPPERRGAGGTGCLQPVSSPSPFQGEGRVRVGASRALDSRPLTPSLSPRGRGGLQATRGTPPARGLAEMAPERGLVAVLALVLFVQGACVVAGLTQTGAADVAGLVGGEQTLDTGYLPLGQTHGDFDKYGPLHYLLYGLAARVFPSGVAWQGYDFEHETPRPNFTSARLVTFLFHLLTTAALVGIGRKHLGSRRRGLVMALAYVLFPPTVEWLTHANRIVPGAWVVLAFWAWPNPLLSGVLLGLATAQWWFPAFLMPLWLGSWPRWRERLMFAAAIAVIGAVFFAFSMRTPPGQTLRERWDLLLEASVLYPKEMSWGRVMAPTDGFWRQLNDWRPGLGALRGVVMAAFPPFCLLLFVLPRRKGPRQVAALTAAVLLGSQLGKNLHGCRYIGWYAGILLVVLLTPARGRSRRRDTENTEMDGEVQEFRESGPQHLKVSF